MHAVEIIGGGLAGLALGIALRRHDVPVTVHESGAYPRQRTCGEFINGLDTRALEVLGITPVLADAPVRRAVSWSQRGAAARHWKLPRPARVVSRHTLDARLAETFAAAQGELATGSRIDSREARPGRVFTFGRRPDGRSPWFGMKMHLAGLSVAADLEFHVGHRAYVGACPLEDGTVNVCGIFHRNPLVTAPGAPGFAAHLRTGGLHAFADRVEAATPVDGSICAVAGLRFGLQPAIPGAPRLGDAFAFTPPYTGRGMASAFHGAALALSPILAWSSGKQSWEFTVSEIHRRLTRLHRSSLGRATAVHRFLLDGTASRAAAILLRARVAPLRALSRFLNPSPPACFYTH